MRLVSTPTGLFLAISFFGFLVKFIARVELVFLIVLTISLGLNFHTLNSVPLGGDLKLSVFMVPRQNSAPPFQGWREGLWDTSIGMTPLFYE